ncbi:hypothetical protein LQ757_10560 [Agromyces sp. SYSU K20354]|uniref:hypothetical protein n=1 Tax=Agromyces cavernae TaxID=2898659 RepID=UPI001E50A276|nr:hypothetical protein [Agromyces cavernae]MCD2442714.1 hypothetical protein [Agromyces cavernae]
MNDHDELDPVARLRAADPAGDVEPREGFADEVVARVTAEATADQGAETSAGSAPVTDIAAARARRRPRWLPIAAVAASIAIVGAAGYGIGSTTGGATNLADGAAPPISLQGDAGTSGGEAASGAMPGGGPTDAAADQAFRDTGAATTDMLYPYPFGGRNSFSSSGLSTEEGAAPAYAYDARGASSAETINALAAALGTDGSAVLKDGAWSVGPQDGTAPYLGVSLDGTLSFWYSNPQVDPWAACGKGVAVDDTVTVDPCAPPADLPSEDAAIEALRSIIVATGRDPETFEFTSDTWEGAMARPAQAWPVVDGQRIDQSWSLELTSQGVYSVSGALAPIIALGDYDIISEQEGFERLSDPRFGAQMGIMPFAAREQAAIEGEQWVAPTEPPATPTEGASLSWPVNEVEIVSARLGLASQWQPDGSVLVAPAYEFTDADGGTWSVIAVEDSMLDFDSQQ